MEKKTTQKEYFTDIINVLNGGEPTIPVEESIEFLNGRIAQLDKKSASKKPTKTQEENVVLKETIVNILTEMGTPVTASSILTDNRIPAGTSLPKVVSLLTALVKSGEVVRTTDKRKAYFSVPTNEVEDTEE